MSLHRSARWFDWAGERFSAHSFGDDRLPRFEAAVDPVGTAAPLPTPPPDAFPFLPIMEASMNDDNRKIPLRLAAWSLMRSKSYLGAYLRRQRSRLGAPKAITACAHKLARILYNLMRHGVAYMRQEEAAYAEQVRARLEKQLQRRAKELGFEVKKIEPAETATAAQ